MNNNDDKINALAREYAEECIDPNGFSNATYEEMVEEKAQNVAYVLRWLSTRFCLVEKEAVRKEYNETKRAIREGHRERLCTMVVVHNSRRVLLESLFPEIAKEVSHG